MAVNGGGGSTGQEPDVLLDVSELEVDRISLEVEDLRAHVSILAELANLVSLSVETLDELLEGRLGDASATLEQVLEVLEADDTVDELLKGRLENVRSILQNILESHGSGAARAALSEGPVNDTGSTAPESSANDTSTS